jgi:ferredoxin-NADP reductase
MIVATDTASVLNERTTPNSDVLRVRIAAAGHATSQVRTLKLVAEHGGTLPGFTAGAHIYIEVILPDGERANRSYSIASPPSNEPTSYLLGVLYEENGTGGSVFMHERARTGYVLDITKPKNFFELVEGANHSILIAGGIGITPILAMAHALTAQGQSMEIHYAARSEEDMAFRKTVEEVCGDNAHLYFDGGDPKHGVDIRAVLGTPQLSRHVYVCGPKGMIDAVRRTADELGWPEDQVHFEVFTPPEAKAGDQPIEVTIRSTGQTLTVQPGTLILDAILAAGVDSNYDCRMGICGSCAVKVLDGESDKRDSVLTTSEHVDEKLMCTCVSWASTPKIVLDH